MNLSSPLSCNLAPAMSPSSGNPCDGEEHVSKSSVKLEYLLDTHYLGNGDRSDSDEVLHFPQPGAVVGSVGDDGVIRTLCSK